MREQVLRAHGTGSKGLFGFVWAQASDEGPMVDAAVGKVIANPDRGPPFIVVYNAIESVLISKWPGALWYVKIVDAASEADQNWQLLLPSAPGTRDVAVEILERVSPSELFGPCGEGVVDVLDAAINLTRLQAVQLASNRDRSAASVHDRVFRSWLAAIDQATEHPESYDGVLACGSWRPWSPIGGGLSLINGCVFSRAVEIDGVAATASDDEEIWLEEPWSGADRALRDAALGFGVANLAAHERESLLRAWKSTFGTSGIEN